MIGLDLYSRQFFIYLDPILIYISIWIDCLFEIRKIAVCLLWLSLPGDYRVTDGPPSFLWIFSLLLKDLISGFYFELQSWFLAYRLCPRCNYWQISINIWLIYMYVPFPTLASCVVSNLVNKIAGEPLELWSWQQAYYLGTWCRWPEYLTEWAFSDLCIVAIRAIHGEPNMS